ncbi:MAG: radical SAM family heme chaperone HemW [Rhodanobacteraceae bacterium]
MTLHVETALLKAPPLSLYIHIPWCVRKCPYCDFNSHAQTGALPVDEYVNALLADLDRDLHEHAAALAERPLVSLFFGGGTPSLFAPDAIARVIDGVAKRLAIERDAEITLETNPGTVEHGRFDGYLGAGVNRISFGVQSFDDDKLRRLGRIHTAAETEIAIRDAQDAGYDNINLDLMYALPEQTLNQALEDIERALAFAPMHLSHYQLTLEPNTLFAARPPPLPDEDAAWEMQEHCAQRIAHAGFEHYEVSAYSRRGSECVHNSNYWSFGDYLGIGAGAHGKISDAATGAVIRTTKLKVPRGYLERHAGAGRFGHTDSIAADQLPFEFMLNVLRLYHGVPTDTFAQRTGLPLSNIAVTLRQAGSHGWLCDEPGRLRASALGQRFLNDLMELFLPDRPRT